MMHGITRSYQISRRDTTLLVAQENYAYFRYFECDLYSSHSCAATWWHSFTA